MYKYLLYSTTDSHFPFSLRTPRIYVDNYVGKVLQEQGNDKASSCH